MDNSKLEELKKLAPVVEKFREYKDWVKRTKEAEELLESPPANVIFKKKADANAFMDKIAPLNCIAFLKTNYY